MDIQEHAFFQDVNWVDLLEGRMVVPWVPDVSGSLDSKHFDKEFTSMNPAGN